MKAHEVFRCLSLILVVAMTSSIQAQSPSIDGGLTWTGWTDKGLSNQLGVWGNGPTDNPFRVYATSFYFENNSKTGNPVGGGGTGGGSGFGTGSHSAGAFSNGNRIFGIGVRMVDGPLPNNFSFVRFDLTNNAFRAATSVGGTDGRTSISDWGRNGDFSVQFAHDWAGQEVSIQTGQGAQYGGPSIIGPGTPGYVAGSSTGWPYDFPFRAFAQSNSYQMFFDVTKMQALYSSYGMGTIGDTINFSLFGPNGTNVAFGNTFFNAPPPIPEPASLSAMAAGLTSLLLWRRRTTKS
ncbi:MAG: PEP-CTERM sorting domain-containing protein [Planctomycetota bacterium]